MCSSRRRLTWALVAALVAVALVVVDGQGRRLRVRTGGGGGGSTLSISDLTLDGAFQLPAGSTADGSDNIYQKGLAVRYVSGAAHVFVLTLDGNVAEYTVPALKTPAGGDHTYYNDATLYAFWGDILGSGTRSDDNSTSGTSFQKNCADEHWGGSTGLFWDTTNSWLFKTYRADYPQGSMAYQACFSGAPSTADPYWGYGTVNDASISGSPPAGTATGVGTWRTQTYFYKGLSTGLLEVPAAWRSAFGGNRLALWGGGYSSLVCNPDINDSAGPNVASFDVSSLPTTQGAALAITRFLNHVGAYCSGGITRAALPALAETRTNLAEPGVNDVFAWQDLVTGMCFVDTGTKSALISFEWVWTKVLQYAQSYISRGGADAVIRFYKVQDVLDAKNGSVGYDDVVATSVARYAYADLNYAVPALHSSTPVSCSSLTGTIGTQDGAATCTAHGFTDGQFVYFDGANEASLNVVYAVVSHTANTMVLSRARSGDNFTVSPATGTFQARLVYTNGPTAPNALEPSRQAVACDDANRRIWVSVQVPFTPATSSTWRNVIYRFSY